MGLFNKKNVKGSWENWVGKCFEFDFSEDTWELVNVQVIDKIKYLAVKPVNENRIYNVNLSTLRWWREVDNLNL